MSIITAPITFLPGSLCFNNFGGNRETFFFCTFDPQAGGALDERMRPMGAQSFVADNLQVFNLGAVWASPPEMGYSAWRAGAISLLSWGGALVGRTCK